MGKKRETLPKHGKNGKKKRKKGKNTGKIQENAA
jgi:hypothetical protein